MQPNRKAPRKPALAFTARRVAASWLSLGALTAAALVSCSAPGKGAIMLAVSTDMQAPKDLDIISVFVATGSSADFDFLGRVPPVDFIDDGSANGLLPPADVPLGSADAPEGDTQFDALQIAYTTCDFDKLQQTQINGVCVSAAVDASSLGAFDPTQVLQGGTVQLLPGICDKVTKAGAQVFVQVSGCPAKPLSEPVCEPGEGTPSSATDVGTTVALQTLNTANTSRRACCSSRDRRASSTASPT